ncbi:RagB/SusD family nutrient uptake outer membrane protein [bacterium]|nr:RagB/SusD family nutrient uptake outer membrane protein [bacterium]
MRLKQYIVFLAVIILGFSMTACDKDFLDLTNPNQMTVESFWRNAEDVESALTGTYALLQHQWWGGYWAPGEMFMTMEVMSDLTQAEIFYPIGEGGHDSYNASSTEYTTYYFWQENYKMIFAANQVIENAPTVEGLTEAEVLAFVAEARFLRAYGHFQLLQLYGNIVVVTEVPPTPDDFYKEQSTPEQAYQQIEEDLQFAKINLPDGYAEAWLGRATKGAAAAYLGKVYLFQEKWAQAETEFRAVAGMGYSLVNDVHSLFTGLNEHSSESIFEINFTATRPADRIESQSLVPNFNDWRGLWPSDHLKTMFIADTTAAGEPSARTFASVIFNHPDSDVWYFEGKTFADYYGGDDSNIYYKKYAFYDPENDPYWYASVGTNFIMMRYADVLLMLAEALVEQGNAGEAAQYVNQVRIRAGAVPINGAMSAADVLHHIREVERPLELCNETSRFFDLVRWYKNDGGVMAALQANDAPNWNQFNDGVDEIWPLPDAEIKANPNVMQNPGY